MRHCHYIQQCITCKSCYLKFTTSKIQRLQRVSEAMDNASSPKKTRRRLNVSSSYQVPKCFFCDDSSGQLHKASTIDIDTRVRECATKLNDSALLAKMAMCQICMC